MHHYKLVIFDWDGTLMDSVDRIVFSMQASAIALALEPPCYQQAKQIIGLSLPKAIKTLFPSLHEAQIQQFTEQYKHQYVEVNTTPTPLFNYALELLVNLKKEKKLLAVATGKARAGLQRVWQASDTEHFFHASRCADESISKPDPDMINSLLKELHIQKHEAVMIGDTSFDLEMAQRAGVDSIGVTYGVHDDEVLSKFQPKAIVDSLAELHQLLLNTAVKL
ncbi:MULTISPECIES: HAD-IA family hydrolase [unclassified Colwellia]|uniref:HAD-IA family hydrolase n=1 Tax=unclassified Colwellia TaxID=196834 RepID=UPI0015F5C65F|nr:MULTISPECIES: HAD-IA family hydrolase [unclassified Colwellia]MBA6232196.1 HAD-IA family hydrolase [Colwellia sp. MB02u-7]MBA6238231.1 HAD-IA family hydrolase [Colwellia sp. MB02u-11]MBA6254486.1 HAD-IA family hydrolase [Colwellia sp. MB3u-28]MBA6262125.1 HAD-IA family hydrolase [Colwellia sp. MB3u-41]MBA6299632.1 HAD-IA family hydrolase [Colwellia sp. MB3u-22]